MEKPEWQGPCLEQSVLSRGEGVCLEGARGRAPVRLVTVLPCVWLRPCPHKPGWRVEAWAGTHLQPCNAQLLLCHPIAITWLKLFK